MASRSASSFGFGGQFIGRLAQALRVSFFRRFQIDLAGEQRDGLRAAGDERVAHRVERVRHAAAGRLRECEGAFR
jgi:hypothetical protein